MNHSQDQSASTAARNDSPGDSMSPADVLLAMDIAASLRYDQWGNPRTPGPVRVPVVYDQVPRYVRPQDIFPPPRTPERRSIPDPGSLAPTQCVPYGKQRTPDSGAHASSHLVPSTSGTPGTPKREPRAPSQPQSESTVITRSAPRPMRFPVPLPSDTDPDFRIKIQVQDEIGLRLTLDRLQTESPLNQAIARNVTAANQSLDGKIRGYEVWIQNAYFAAQSTGRMSPSSIPKNPQQGFTVGHLLTILVQKQYKHWKNFMRSATTNGLAELGDLVGPAAGSLKKHSVGWGTVYAVAIRRRKLRDGHWCYFLQLEIRVSEQWRP
ncbi:hypothetical protein PYCCODRAFT_1479078 [Trametes coccinea BRFM310]|uniref:Uncharacterized protein n=1 Tax=Trametes coccinea (strain BRFM310) TaxID=1353009 RepID=A0A1Y2IHL9_TRAC3|nr:hypothetical protein PYCCODRAFT_1479078 [Trametes coccinea BRFM310]